MTDERDREIADLKARLEAVEGTRPAATISPAKKKGIAGNIVIAACLLLAALFIIGQCGTEGPSASSAPEFTWSPPPGYSAAATNGPGVGYKWSEPTRAECRQSGGTCFAMDVITEKACSRSLYVSITLMSEADRNIGWTNDTAQGVGAMEPVRLVFTTYEDGAKSARIADVSCY